MRLCFRNEEFAKLTLLEKIEVIVISFGTRPFTVNFGQLRTLRTPSGPADSLGTCEDPRDLQSLWGPADSIAPNNGRLFRSNFCKA